MGGRLAAALVSVALVAGSGTADATQPPSVFAPPGPPPELTAEAWLLYDATAGVMLASHNAGEVRPMASVTKLMTGLVAVEQAGLDDLVVVSGTADAVGEAEIGLVPGEVWTMRDLVGAIMVRSGNDAAVAIAEHVGGSVPGFAALMNARAAELGLTGTSFTNPHGLDEEGHHTTAEDLLTLALVVLDHPVLSRFVRTRVIRFLPDPEGEPRRADNTNALLGAYPGVTGLKTGFTGQAGRVLVASAERSGRMLVTVVMGSQDHFDDTRRLLEYGHRVLSPADVLAAAGRGEEGGGGPAGGPGTADWERARAAAVPVLDPGRDRATPPGDTPAGRAVDEKLRVLLPAFLG